MSNSLTVLGHLIWKQQFSTEQTTENWEKEFYLEDQGLYFLITEINEQVTVKKIIVID